jgi:hypothetical protein
MAVLGELTLRAITGNWHPEALFVPDERLIATLAPILDTEVASAVGGSLTRIHIQSDSAGYRDDGQLDGTRPRIVVYGDSNILARFAATPATFPAQLEVALGGRYAVVNAGVDGYGPDQSYLRMQAELERLHPALIVLHLFADNDYGDLVRNDLFRLQDGKLVATDRPPDDAAFGEMNNLGARFLTVRAILGVATKLGLVADEPAVMSPERGLAECASEYAIYQQGGHSGWLDDHYDFDLALRPDSDSAKLKLALMRAVLGAAQDFGSQHAVPILFLVEPSSLDMTTNVAVNHDTLGSYPGYDRRRLYDSLVGMLEAQHSHYVGLWDVYAAAGADRMYFKVDNNHWSPEGMMMAAQATAKAINALLSGPTARTHPIHLG